MDMVANTQDCDDSEAAAHPGNPEVCDGVDNDCNLLIDDDASDAALLSVDSDGDGFGVTGTAVFACPGAGGALQDGDCNMALAGGVNAILAPVNSLLMSKANLLAPDGRCPECGAPKSDFAAMP